MPARLKRRHRVLVRCACALLAFTGPAAPAFDDTPFNVRNLSPFVDAHLGFGLGFPGEAGGDRGAVDIGFSLTSHFTDDESASERIDMDGETSRLAFGWQRPLTDGWRFGLTLPVIHYDGGFLDSFLIDYHDTLGLRSLGRDEVDNDRLMFRYSRDGETRVRIDEPGTAAGDLAVYFMHARDDEARPLRTLAYLKLPTGDPDRLTGSGAPAVGARIGRQLGRFTAFDRPLSVFVHGGAVYYGDADDLEDVQRNYITHAGVAFAFGLTAAITLKLQFDVHTSLYEESKLRQLERTAVIWTTGATVAAGENWLVDISIQEDEFAYDTSPDVSFVLGIRRSIR